MKRQKSGNKSIIALCDYNAFCKKLQLYNKAVKLNSYTGLPH